MPTTSVQQILDKVAARFANRTEENGYFHDYPGLDRGKLTPFSGSDETPTTNYWAGETVITERGAGWERKQTEILVECHTSHEDTIPFIDTAEKLAADMIVALNRNTTAPKASDKPSLALGGLVEGFYVESVIPEIGQGEAPFCGALVAFTCVYKAKPNDPFTILN